MADAYHQPPAFLPPMHAIAQRHRPTPESEAAEQQSSGCSVVVHAYARKLARTHAWTAGNRRRGQPGSVYSVLVHTAQHGTHRWIPWRGRTTWKGGRAVIDTHDHVPCVPLGPTAVITECPRRQPPQLWTRVGQTRRVARVTDRLRSRRQAPTSPTRAEQPLRYGLPPGRMAIAATTAATDTHMGTRAAYTMIQRWKSCAA